MIKASTEATCTGPCSALLPSNYNTHQKEGRETTLPLVVLAGNPTPEKDREKENKMFFEERKGCWKGIEEVCKDMKKEKESECQSK